MLLVAVLLVIVFLLIALTTWLSLLLFALALCRGAAAADAKELAARKLAATARRRSNAATERYPSGAAPGSRARVTVTRPRQGPRNAAPQHGFPSRTRRETKHAPRAI